MVRNLALHVCTYFFCKFPVYSRKPTISPTTTAASSTFSPHPCWLPPPSLDSLATCPMLIVRLGTSPLHHFASSDTGNSVYDLLSLHYTPMSSDLDVGGKKGEGKVEMKRMTVREDVELFWLVFTLQRWNLVKVVGLFGNSSDIMGFQRMCSYSWYLSLLFRNKK